MKNYWLICLTFLFFGCVESMPENILSEEKMQVVLADIHTMEGIGDANIRHIKARKNFREDMQDEILKKHGLDRPTFLRSYEYYLNHPILMDSIYYRMIKDYDQKMEQSYDKSFGKESPQATKPGAAGIQ
ncbi:MAG: DUF4296 domain-containing protein [Bacteroidia bacterium]|nr:DUF4296 domain-containing protein [Bacteroidia bacterium]